MAQAKKQKSKTKKPAAKRVAVKKTSHKSVRSRVSAAEWDARVNLAAAYRLMDLYGMTDHISNQIGRAHV